MVSFVMSHFTKVPLKDYMDLLKPLFVSENCRSSYFLYGEQSFEQLGECMAMLSLTPVVANLYMEHLEHVALDRAP